MKKSFRLFTSLRESGSPKSSATSGGRIYKNVTIIKSGLGNRRDRNYYPPETLQESAKKGQFEGIRAFADHPDAISEETRPERSVRDIVGVYTNTRFKESKDGGAVVGDLRVLKSAKWLSSMIDELVDMGQADKIGISINGRGETEPQRIKLAESGEELDANVLQRFLDLRSADVVTEAGAGGGFQQLLESARGAKENTSMTRAEFKTLREAANKGDKTAIAKLAKAVEATLVTPTAEADAADAPPAGKKKAKKKGAAAADGDPDDMEEADASADAELDAAADALVEEADGSTDEDAEDAEEGDDVEEAEGEDEDAEDAEEGDDVEEAEGEDEEEVAPRAKKPVTKKTREAVPTMKVKATKPLTGKGKQTAEATPKNHKGVATSGAGAATSNAKGMLKKGNKFGYMSAKKGGSVSKATESDNALVKKLQLRNERLAEALRVRQGADKAKKMLRESRVPENMRPTLLRRMVGRSDEEMRGEIDYTERLLESMGQSAQMDDDFDQVEGAGARIRESFSRGDEADIDTLLEGLPLREASADEGQD